MCNIKKLEEMGWDETRKDLGLWIAKLRPWIEAHLELLIANYPDMIILTTTSHDKILNYQQSLYKLAHSEN